MDLVRKRFLSMLLPDEGVVTGDTTCGGGLCAWVWRPPAYLSSGRATCVAPKGNIGGVSVSGGARNFLKLGLE